MPHSRSSSRFDRVSRARSLASCSTFSSSNFAVAVRIRPLLEFGSRHVIFSYFRARVRMSPRFTSLSEERIVALTSPLVTELSEPSLSGQEHAIAQGNMSKTLQKDFLQPTIAIESEAFVNAI
jgi:hypothetical protein